MTTEDPRPETPAPDDPTVSSVGGSASEPVEGAAETAAAAEETAAARCRDRRRRRRDRRGRRCHGCRGRRDRVRRRCDGGCRCRHGRRCGRPPPAPPAPPAAPPAPPAGWAPPPPPRPRYPIDVRFDRDQQIGRFWAIPIIGWFVRWLVLLPHYILLGLFSIVVFFATLVTWIPVLLTGRFPGWGYSIIGGFYRWYIRVDQLPIPDGRPVPAVLADGAVPGRGRLRSRHPDQPPVGHPDPGDPTSARCWPSRITSCWRSSASRSTSSILVAWIAVLVNGRYPQVGYDIVGGFFRWSMRVSGWILLMAGPYPPFRLDD